MITCLGVDGVHFSDKRNRTLLKKMIAAATDGATEGDLQNILITRNVQMDKLTLDTARILHLLQAKFDDILRTVEVLGKEADTIGKVGNVMAKHVKNHLAKVESLEDDYTALSWKQDKKLVVTNKKKNNKPEPAAKKTRRREK